MSKIEQENLQPIQSALDSLAKTQSWEQVLLIDLDPNLKLIQLQRILNGSARTLSFEQLKLVLKAGVPFPTSNPTMVASVSEFESGPKGGFAKRAMRTYGDRIYRRESTVVEKRRLDKSWRTDPNVIAEASSRTNIQISSYDEWQLDVKERAEQQRTEKRISLLDIRNKRAKKREVKLIFEEELVRRTLAKEPDEVSDLTQWLEDVGYGSDWVLDGDKQLLESSLSKLQTGERVDFNIWNGLKFDWKANPRGGLPLATITDKANSGYAVYFKDRVLELANRLGGIGNANINILVPSQEALDDKVWNYTQSQVKREELLDQAVANLRNQFGDLNNIPGINFSVKRWDQYLAENRARFFQAEYSKQGEDKLRVSSDSEQIISSAVKSGVNYFASRQISVTPQTLQFTQPRYYGVYAGEGVFYKELQGKDVSVVVVNFEEFRCAQMAKLGADGNLPVITPISGKELNEYYQQS